MYVYSRSKLLNLVFQNIYQSIPPISTKWKITSHHNWTHLAQKKPYTWCWKSRFWLGTSTKMWRG